MSDTDPVDDAREFLLQRPVQQYDDQGTWLRHFLDWLRPKHPDYTDDELREAIFTALGTTTEKVRLDVGRRGAQEVAEKARALLGEKFEAASTLERLKAMAAAGDLDAVTILKLNKLKPFLR